jgi:hypothetical protein
VVDQLPYPGTKESQRETRVAFFALTRATRGSPLLLVSNGDALVLVLLLFISPTHTTRF